MVRRPPPVKTGQRVLLVEDDALIRALTTDMLADLGYQVVQAAEADAALRLLDGVDLIITDLGLGETDGLALAAAVRARLPCVPVIVASGRADQELAESGLLWLRKPFDKAALRAVLAQVHHGRPAEP
jgi:CheY-like chemotaxis protein